MLILLCRHFIIRARLQSEVVQSVPAGKHLDPEELMPLILPPYVTVLSEYD
jgi:hypothetical protein